MFVPAGARASGALQMLVYHKVLKLGSASEQILGKVVNICINDMERVMEGFRLIAFVICEWSSTSGHIIRLRPKIAKICINNKLW